jgi:aspartate dehydrogenase
MALRRLGIIGAGGIADLALSTLANGLTLPLVQVSILVPEQFAKQAQELLDRLGGTLAASRAVRTDLAAFLADKPDVVAECASHTAVENFGPPILESGCDLIVISIGSLSDDALRAKLETAAKKGGSRILLPSGAIGGVDALSAARLSGLEQVIYTGRKPPNAWRKTPAEKLLDLDSLKEPTVFFEGSARTAAHDYPFNANVAATLALAGIGFEQTQVRLVADPGISTNVHEFAVRSGCGNFTMRLEGKPSAANPKTSQMAGYSVARELLNRAGTIVI